MESAPTDPDSGASPAARLEDGAGDRRAARFFLALGDPTRLAILRLLRADERNVGELVALLEVPQPKVSRHLKVLRRAGLVVASKEGRTVRCRLATPKLWPAEGKACLEVLFEGMTLGSGETGAPHEAGSRSAAAPISAPAPAAAGPPPRPDLETHLL